VNPPGSGAVRGFGQIQNVVALPPVCEKFALWNERARAVTHRESTGGCKMGLRAGSGPQPMQLDVSPGDALTAESLAEILTSAELHSLLDLHMPPCEVDLVEEALALRHESFLHSLPASMQSSTSITPGQVVVGFARLDVICRKSTKRPLPAGW